METTLKVWVTLILFWVRDIQEVLTSNKSVEYVSNHRTTAVLGSSNEASGLISK